MEVEGLTAAQQEACKKFRDVVKDVVEPHWTDHDVCRWMIARDFNITEAEKMLRKSLAWRKLNDADHLIEWTPSEVLRQYYPGGHGGYDKDGYPVWMELTSYLDMKGMLYSVKKSDILKYEARQIELGREIMAQQTKKLGRPIHQCTIIMDLAQLGLRHLWTPGLQLYGDVLDMTEANYPDNLRRVYIINAPRLFPVIYNMLKPFLHEETQQKIHVLGGDWKERLRQVIDPAQLPKAWGGDREVDGDPYCKIPVGGDIPKTFYMKNGSHDHSHMTSITVNRGAKSKVEVNVTSPHSTLKWEFKTAKYDIGFGVHKVPSGNNKGRETEEVVPIAKVNSHMVLQDGYVDCPTPGTYVVIFDNRYSWVHAKAVDYHLEVIESNLAEDKNSYVATEIPAEANEDTKM